MSDGDTPVTSPAKQSWRAPVILVGAWLLVFWAWYAGSVTLRHAAWRATAGHRFSEDQMMALADRSSELRSWLQLVAFPISCVALVLVTSRLRVWTWGIRRAVAFVFGSAGVAVLVWYLSLRLAGVHAVNITLSASNYSTMRRYIANPLGDTLAYAAVPLMVVTTLSLRWWGRRRIRQGKPPTPLPPSRWTGRQVGLLWLIALTIDVALGLTVRLGLMTSAEHWILGMVDWLPPAMSSVLLFAAIATAWWLTDVRRARGSTHDERSELRA